MGIETDINAKQLYSLYYISAKMLDKIHPHFAYHMLILEVTLHSEGKFMSQKTTQTDSIT
jgi:hypothetical protein